MRDYIFPIGLCVSALIIVALILSLQDKDKCQCHSGFATGLATGIAMSGRR